MTIRLEPGNCLEVMRRLAEEGVKVDAIVTDPPYHLTSIVKRFGNPDSAPAKSDGATGVYGRASSGFMGKAWDGGDVAFNSVTWGTAASLLKPGGWLLAFGGTRTYHKLGWAVEGGGFEIRDMVSDLIASDGLVRRFMESLNDEQQAAFLRCLDDSQFGGMLSWLFGSGFPKSHDVSKAMDRQAGVERPVTGTMGKSGLATAAENYEGNQKWSGLRRDEPATDEAAQWQGWGTALKPACEPICVARKPLSEGSVAANVLKWGTGALNIDASRVPSSTGQRPNGGGEWEQEEYLCASCARLVGREPKPETQETKASSATRLAEPTSNAKGETSPADTDKTDIGCFDGMKAADTSISSSIGESGNTLTGQSQTAALSTTSTKIEQTTGSKTCRSCGAEITRPTTSNNGRWPSNVVHDGSDEVEEAFAAFGEQGGGYGKRGGGGSVYSEDASFRGDMREVGYGDTGTASRFFYTAKADKHDRWGSKHPTVKPVDLMRWLVRLVTPPGGLVLDPFAGSGTTGIAAMAEGFDCILIEREEEYLADIRERLAFYEGDGKHSLASKHRKSEAGHDDLPLFGDRT